MLRQLRQDKQSARTRQGGNGHLPCPIIIIHSEMHLFIRMPGTRTRHSRSVCHMPNEVPLAIHFDLRLRSSPPSRPFSRPSGLRRRQNSAVWSSQLRHPLVLDQIDARRPTAGKRLDSGQAVAQETRTAAKSCPEAQALCQASLTEIPTSGEAPVAVPSYVVQRAA